METTIVETPPKLNVFVARQPIFDQSLNVYAYELLFRTGGENLYSHHDGDQASSRVIANSLFIIGLKRLTEGKKAFINFTEKLLLEEIATLIPRDFVAVEILETIEHDDSIVKVCERLKTLGYMIVLDDYKLKTPRDPLLSFADIVKIDIKDTSDDELKKIRKRINPFTTKLLAEKVETHDEFQKVLDLGCYTYFQGYFFCKPVTFAGRDMPAYKVTYLRLLREIHKSEPDIDEIERFLKGDVSTSYKLLRTVNSVAYGLHCKVNSLKHALILLGIREVRSWVSLIALQGLGDDKPTEIIELSIIRGRFAELLARKIGMAHLASDLFLMGLFSMIDAIVDRPLAELLEEIPLSDDVKSILLEGEGPYKMAYQLVIANERGEWDKIAEISGELELDEMEIPSLFIDSLEWTQELLRA